MNRASVITLAVVAAVAMAGCANVAQPPSSEQSVSIPLAQVSPVADPRTLVGPGTAALADHGIEQLADPQPAQLPVRVMSHFHGGDRPVEVRDISRVVAFDLSGSIAATVWGLGLGDRLVARDVSTNFPGTEGLPLVTEEGHAVNAEAVLAARPTVIITDGSLGPRDVVEQLADTGVPVVFVENSPTYSGAAQLARDVASALGVPADGERLAKRISAEVAEVKTQIARLTPVPAKRLRMVFLYLRANSGVYYLLGSDSGADEVIAALGGIDVGAELGWSEMQPLTDEAIVAAKPELILVMTHGLASAGGVDGLLAEKPALALTPAGEHQRFIDMADGEVLSFGPRAASVLSALASAVYTPGRQP